MGDGVYVQSKSGGTAKITGAAAQYGAAVTGYSIRGGGYSGTSATLQTGLLGGSGTVPFVFRVTDSRGSVSYTHLVMSCIKEQLLEKWGGELEFDNFTVHLRSALGQDRRYPIRDGRNIAGITVTEDYEPVVTRLHVRGYENANFEEINDGKDWIDSELRAQYAYAREGYADFDDVDDPQELSLIHI